MEPWMLRDLRRQAELTMHSKDTHNRRSGLTTIGDIKQRARRRRSKQHLRDMAQAWERKRG